MIAASPSELTPDEARSEFSRELLDSRYSHDGLSQRVWAWIQEMLARTSEAAMGLSPFSIFMALLLTLIAVVVVLLLVNRLRASGSRARPTDDDVLFDEVRTSADEYRRRAEAQLEDGDAAGAVVDAFRALARRQVEYRRIDELPGATVAELARQLRELRPDEAPAVDDAARLFDLALYGDRPLARTDAEAVLALDTRWSRR